MRTPFFPTSALAAALVVGCAAHDRSVEAPSPPIAPAPDSREDPVLADLLRLLDEARAAQESEDDAAARSLASEAIDRALAELAGREDPAACDLIEKLSFVAYKAGEFRRAEQAGRMLLEVRSRTLPDDHVELQDARMNLATYVRELGDLEEARALDERVLEVYLRTFPEESPETQGARSNLSGTLAALGDLRGARELDEKVLEVASRTLPEDHPRVQKARLTLAATLRHLGDPRGARALYERVLDAYARTSPEKASLLRMAQQGLGLARYDVADLDGARSIQQRLVDDLSQELPDDHWELLSAQLNLGTTIYELGDLRGARVLFERVLDVGSRTLPADHRLLRHARANLATTLWQLGDPEGARGLEDQVFEVESRTLPANHPDRLLTQVNYAGSLFERGDFDGARELLEQVIDTCVRTLPEDHERIFAARGNLATMLEERGYFEDALALFELVHAVAARTRPDDAPQLQMARENIARTTCRVLARRLGSSGESREHAPATKEARERCTELLQAVCRGQIGAARTALLESSVREAESRCGVLAGGLEYPVSFAAGNGVLDPITELDAPSFVLSEITRGATLTAAALMRRGSSAPGYSKLKESLREQSEEIADLAQEGTTSTEFQAALGRRDLLQRQLARLARDAGGGAAAGLDFDVASLTAELSGDEAAVGFRRYSRWSADPVTGAESRVPSLCAFVLRGETDGPICVELGPVARIQQAVHAWRSDLGIAAEGRGVAAGLASDPSERIDDRGRDLRRLVFDPLRDALGDASHVIFALDDVLHLVPLDALPADESALLGDRLRIDTRVTLTELLSRDATGTGNGLVVVGGVAFGSLPGSTERPGEAASILRGGAWSGGFPELPGTLAEGRAIALAFEEVGAQGADSTRLEGSEATREKLIELAPSARWLHIATHGWFASESIRSWRDEEPLDKVTGLGARLSGEDQVRGMSPMLLCGLALAGANLPEDELGRVPGLITAEEIAALDLASCELAVLSACDTNVGEHRAGQGVASLQMALQLAGARSVITSLWRVPDEATRELMVDFYRRIWVEKKPKAQSLWEAKTKLRATKDENGRPRYSTRDWAAWVLTGDPR